MCNQHYLVEPWNHKNVPTQKKIKWNRKHHYVEKSVRTCIGYRYTSKCGYIINNYVYEITIK